MFVLSPESGGETRFGRLEWDGCPSAHKCGFCPPASTPLPAPAAFTFGHSKTVRIWRVLSTTELGNVTQAREWGGGCNMLLTGTGKKQSA